MECMLLVPILSCLMWRFENLLVKDYTVASVFSSFLATP